MKKITLLILFTLTSSFFTLCNAQFTDIYNLNNAAFPQGLNPYGSFVFNAAGDSAFGLSAYASYGAGNVFMIDASGYTDFYDFTGTDGAYPAGTRVTLVPSIGGHLDRFYGKIPMNRRNKPRGLSLRYVM